VCEYLETLPLGSHGIICYDTDDELVQVFSSYLKGALERNEAFRLIAPTQNAHASILRRADLDAELLKGDERVRLWPMTELFARTEGNPLDMGSVTRSIRKLGQDGIGRFKGTRVISLSEHYLDYTSPDNLLRLENELGRTFDLPLSVICTYDGPELIKRGLGEVMLGLFRHHGRIIGKELTLDNL